MKTKTPRKISRKRPTKVAKRVVQETPEVTPVVAPEITHSPIVDEVMVIGLANNPRFVYGKMDGGRIAIEVPMWMAPRLTGKTIKVTKKLDSEYYALAPDGN